MARCVRDGHSYKRHKFVNGKCEHCQVGAKPKPKKVEVGR